MVKYLEINQNVSSMISVCDHLKKKWGFTYYYLCAINSHEMSCTDSRYTFWLFYASYLISHASASTADRISSRPRKAQLTPLPILSSDTTHSILLSANTERSYLPFAGYQKAKPTFFCFHFLVLYNRSELLL